MDAYGPQTDPYGSAGQVLTPYPSAPDRPMTDFEGASHGVDRLREMYLQLREENMMLKSQLRDLHMRIKETQAKLTSMDVPQAPPNY